VNNHLDYSPPNRRELFGGRFLQFDINFKYWAEEIGRRQPTKRRFAQT